MNRFSLLRLPTLPEAQAHVMQDHESRPFRAGGIDLLDRMKEGLLQPEQLVELSALSDAFGTRMRGVRTTEDGVAIGALVTLAQLAGHDLPAGYHALRDAADKAASPGIRNAATVGGNLLQRPRCWYYRAREIQCLKKGGSRCFAIDGENRYHAVLGGGPAYIVHPSSLGSPLLALGARVVVASDGAERTIPLAELFHLPTTNPTTEHTLKPGEVLLEVLLPRASGAQRSAYAVAKERSNYDWPLAEAVAKLDLDGGVMKNVQVALGHVAPIPWDAANAAKLLEGQKPDAALFEQAGKAALFGAQPLSQNGYKIPLCAALVRKALHEATGLALPE